MGACGVAWSAEGLLRLQLPEADRGVTERRLGQGAARAQQPPAAMQRAIDDVRRYLDGEAVDFTAIALDLTGVGEFHRRIYAAARGIGWGATATYGELARRVGVPGATRAVGQAMGRDPVPLIVPCHRVLAAGGAIGGFSAHGGARTKQRLLALEGVRLASDTPRLPGIYRVIPAAVGSRRLYSGNFHCHPGISRSEISGTQGPRGARVVCGPWVPALRFHAARVCSAGMTSGRCSQLSLRDP